MLYTVDHCVQRSGCGCYFLVRRFAPEREAMERALLEPVVLSWQRPMSRALALEYYSDLLDLIGRSHDARRFRAILSKMGPSA